MLNYKVQAENDSLYNTPNTFGIYILGLTMKWLRSQGGLEAVAKVNQRKAGKLYAEIDRTGFYRGTARKADRSLMNVTFRLADRGAREDVRQGINGRRSRRPEGTSLRRRHARVDLQRVPGRRRRRARVVHAGVRADARVAALVALRRRWAVRAPSPASSPPARRRRCIGGLLARIKGLRRFDEPLPVFEHLRRLAVNLQPGQRFAERPAVHQRLARARREVHVDEAALKARGSGAVVRRRGARAEVAPATARVLLAAFRRCRGRPAAAANRSRAARAAFRGASRW